MFTTMFGGHHLLNPVAASCGRRTGVFGMMLNPYLPNRFRRYAFAGLAIGVLTALALYAGDSFAGVSSIQSVMSASFTPFSVALLSVPTGFALLLAWGLRCQAIEAFPTARTGARDRRDASPRRQS
jgi:hypothetical protein